MRTKVPVSVPASQSHIMTKLPINTTTVLHGQEQSWEIFQTRCDQLTGPHGSCQILHAGTRASRPAVLYP